MNETTTPPPHDSGPRVTRDALRDISTLRRSRDHRMVGGVAEGLSRHLDIDPIIIRVLFAVLTFFGGAGLCLYLIAWATIPEEGNYHSGVSSILRRDPDRVMIAGLSIAGAVGVITFFTTIGWSSPNPWGLIFFGVVAVAGIALLTRRAEKRESWTPPPPWPTAGGGPGAPPPPYQPAPPFAPYAAPPSRPATPAASAPVSPTEPTEPVRAWWQRDEEAPSAPTPPPPPMRYAPVPPAPRPPKQPRSHLFALTMAVIAIALGLLWIFGAGMDDGDMQPSVYPGSVLVITAVALLISTWYGRSRLLILVGLLAAMATAATVALGPGPIGEQIRRPASTSALQAEYEHGTGRMVLDLSQLSDPQNLDGRTVHIESRIGQIEVIVPSSISAEIDARVNVGEVSGPPDRLVESSDSDGDRATISSAGASGSPDIYLDLDLKLGDILITQYDCGDPGPFQSRYRLPTTSIEGGTDAAPACN